MQAKCGKWVTDVDSHVFCGSACLESHTVKVVVFKRWWPSWTSVTVWTWWTDAFFNQYLCVRTDYQWSYVYFRNKLSLIMIIELIRTESRWRSSLCLIKLSWLCRINNNRRAHPHVPIFNKPHHGRLCRSLCYTFIALSVKYCQDLFSSFNMSSNTDWRNRV